MNDIHLLPAYATNPQYSGLPNTPRRGKMNESIKKFFQKFNMFHDTTSDNSFTPAYQPQPTSSNQRSFKRKWKGFLKKSLLLPIIILALFLVGAGYMVVNGLNTNSNTNVLDNSDQRIEIKKPKSQQTLNKQFSFPLRDAAGKELSQLRYVVETAELRDEIVVKGKRATSVKGRTFLIVNLKITNDFNQPITLNSRDYMRLIVNNNSERLAPDIHNDPVEIQPISTKYTRLGFPINDTDKNLSLQIGEIKGKKELLKLDLQ